MELTSDFIRMLVLMLVSKPRGDGLLLFGALCGCVMFVFPLLRCYVKDLLREPLEILAVEKVNKTLIRHLKADFFLK